MKAILKSTAVRACIYFTIAIALWCAAGLIFAGPVEGIVVTLSLLLASGIMTLLQTLWFTPLVAKHLAYPARIAGFGATALPTLILCAVLGRWLPTDNLGAWISFVIIYLVILAIMTVICTLYYRRTSGNLDEALTRYRASREKERR